MPITTREFGSLQEQLDNEQLLVNKYRAYAVQIADPQLRTKFEQLAARHQEHFNRLLNYLC